MANTDPPNELRWRCRRGMLELDILLRDFLSCGYEGLSAKEQEAFSRLLEFPDQELLELLLGNASPQDREVAGVIEKIRERPAS
jgi:antitoxin CptB